MCEGDYSDSLIVQTSQDRERRIQEAVTDWDGVKDMPDVTFKAFLESCSADIRDDIRMRILAQRQEGS